MSLEVISNVMVYPSDATRKTGGKAGVWNFDFSSGQVTLPDLSTESMSTNLNRLGKKQCRSAFVFVSDADAIIEFGNIKIPVEQQLNYIINGITFDRMRITFPSGRTPTDDFELMVMASDSPIFPYQIEGEIAEHTPPTITGSAGVAYATIFNKHFKGYSQILIITENTDGADSLDVDIQISEDGTNFVSHVNYPKTIAFGNSDSFSSSVKHKFFRVRVKRTGASDADYRLSSKMER